MKMSRYVFSAPYGKDTILYHSATHAVLSLPNECVKSETFSRDLDEESLSALSEMGFFSIGDKKIAEQAEQHLVNLDKLFISLELNLNCNLRCPYCYQAGKVNQGQIEEETLSDLVRYYDVVYKTAPYKDLFLKVLGGEPTLAEKKLLDICEKTSRFCRSRNVRFHLLIDTNGTLIESILRLHGYDSLLLTIPLTHQICHDDVRHDSTGHGTYEKIIKNINVVKEQKPEVKIVLRSNIDKNNIVHFHDFLKDIQNKINFLPLLSLNYTAELNEKGGYKNSLFYDDFIRWSSTEAIDMLVEAELPVTISPNISIEECQYRSQYSLKLFSDGTVGSCAMSFFQAGRMSIKDMVEQFGTGSPFERAKARQALMQDQQCLDCSYLFLCGGTAKLPCILALDPTACERKNYGLYLEGFLQRYMKYSEQDKGHLFTVFQDGESYR